MSTQQAALENLRVIRSLMEKAHIYRAISAPAALVGGLSSLILAVLSMKFHSNNGADVLPHEFLIPWMGVLTVVAVINSYLLAKDAKRRQHPFISSGLKMALRAFAPAFIAGGMFGFGLILYRGYYSLGALIWVVTYGQSLLAISSFSPRSLTRLGWCFLITGPGLFWLTVFYPPADYALHDAGKAAIVMGLTFGLLHIGYGIAVLVRKKPEPLPAE